MNIAKMILVAFAGCTAVASASTEAGYVTNVLVRQRWPWSHKVDIEFTVGGAGPVDVAVHATWDGRQEPLELTAGNGLSGAMYGLSATDGHLVWDPHAAGVSNTLTGFRAEVTSVDSSDRKWLVIDLETGDHEFMKDEPAGGFNADATYKISKMVFRRIPAGTFSMGRTSAQRSILKSYGGLSDYYLNNYFFNSMESVTLTDDYYLALYRLTEAQYAHIQDGSSSNEETTIRAKNANNVSSCYNAFRGTDLEDGTVNWPVTRYQVSDGSVFGRLRALTAGRFVFDLPTEAQWERAARADSAKIWWDFGDDVTATQFTNYIDSVCGATVVKVPGQYAPNAYGLYDMLGAGSELCLDAWSTDRSEEIVNPLGPVKEAAENMNRVGKGGGENSTSSTRCGCVVPACRMPHAADQSRNSNFGRVVFRPAIHLNSVFDR